MAKKIVGLSFFGLGSASIGAFIFVYYFGMKATGDDIGYILPLFVFLGLFVALAIISIIYFVKHLKRKEKTFFVPLTMLVACLAIPSGVCGIEYACSDKATFGVPEKYQTLLSYSTFMEEKMLSASYYDGKSEIEVNDKDNKIQDFLKGISTSGFVVAPDNAYSNEYITITYGTDDFYGMDIYKTGYISAKYHADLLGPSYDLFYTYDSSNFEPLSALIVGLSK